VVVLDRATYQERFDSYGTAAGDRFLTPNGMLLNLDGETIRDSEADTIGSWWLTPGSVLTIGLVDPDGSTAVVGGVRTQDGAWFELGEFEVEPHAGPAFAWLGVCGVDTHHLVCPTGDGFQAWQFATG
jgi:hypothetical protein